MLIVPLGPEPADLLSEEQRRPWVTWTLAAASVAVFLMVCLAGNAPEALGNLVLSWGFHADAPLGMGLIAHMFFHADFWHLFGNMLFLVPFGAVIEDRKGPASVVAIYLLSGVGGAWLFALCATPFELSIGGKLVEFYPPLVGASGAIMGFVGSLVALAPWARIQFLVGGFGWWTVYPVACWVIGILFLFKEAALALAGMGYVTPVAYTAHVGGLVTGAAAGLVFARLSLGAAEPGAAAREAAMREAEQQLRKLPKVRPPPPPPEVIVPEIPSPAIVQDLHALASMADHSPQLAQLKARFRRAETLEEAPVTAPQVEAFYRIVIADRSLPSDHRAYAAARLARLLQTQEKYAEAVWTCRRLLALDLPPGLESHVKETLARAGRPD